MERLTFPCTFPSSVRKCFLVRRQVFWLRHCHRILSSHFHSDIMNAVSIRSFHKTGSYTKPLQRRDRAGFSPVFPILPAGNHRTPGDYFVLQAHSNIIACRFSRRINHFFAHFEKSTDSVIVNRICTYACMELQFPHYIFIFYLFIRILKASGKQ